MYMYLYRAIRLPLHKTHPSVPLAAPAQAPHHQKLYSTQSTNLGSNPKYLPTLHVQYLLRVSFVLQPFDFNPSIDTRVMYVPGERGYVFPSTSV
jgi:hypothetical protein